MRVERCADGGELAARAAALLASLLDGALAARGTAHLALAGGSTPAGAYALLRPSRWEDVELWFGDERCVSPHDVESNYRMAEHTLLGHAVGALVHRIEGELGAQAAADRYDALLRERLGEPILDVVLLGIGEDGHTASLFPGNPALAERERLREIAGVRIRNAPESGAAALLLCGWLRARLGWRQGSLERDGRTAAAPPRPPSANDCARSPRCESATRPSPARPRCSCAAGCARGWGGRRGRSSATGRGRRSGRWAPSRCT